MKLKNGSEYIDSLQKLKPQIYYQGKKIDNIVKHPATALHVRAAAMTYTSGNQKKYRNIQSLVPYPSIRRELRRYSGVRQAIIDEILNPIHRS